MYLNKYVQIVHWNLLPHRLNTLKMEVADSSETFVPIYQATRCYVILILQAVRTPHPSEDIVGLKILTLNPSTISL
jgi:hypothetical protein